MPSKRILIAPLDWGLGHATRCIPIINYLTSLGHAVTIAGKGTGFDLLKNEFPKLPKLALDGYNIWYPKKRVFFTLTILIQVPKILYRISYEKKWLSKILEENPFDLIISDNRYGLYSKKTKTIFITHQLRVISGIGKLVDAAIRWKLYKFINQFDECWIPDNEGPGNIAGKLSDTKIKPMRYRYIGLLSRLEKKNTPVENTILVLLSGPEPQRTLLENILLAQLDKIEQKVIIVRGLKSSKSSLLPATNLEIHEQMDSTTLSLAMSKAAVVVCRSGYSSIMDLIKMQKKAVLIPTPGQTEQIYLADQMQKKGYFTVQDQDSIYLKKGLNDCGSDHLPQNNMNYNGFEKAILDLGI